MYKCNLPVSCCYEWLEQIDQSLCRVVANKQPTVAYKRGQPVCTYEGLMDQEVPPIITILL